MSLDHVILGLLRDGPSSGYDLRRDFETGARLFWYAELSQIYPTLKRLERRQLVTSAEADSARGPRRRVYRVTNAGLEELKRWVAAGPDIGRERLAHVAQFCFLHRRLHNY